MTVIYDVLNVNGTKTPDYIYDRGHKQHLEETENIRKERGQANE